MEETSSQPGSSGAPYYSGSYSPETESRGPDSRYCSGASRQVETCLFLLAWEMGVWRGGGGCRPIFSAVFLPKDKIGYLIGIQLGRGLSKNQQKKEKHCALNDKLMMDNQ